MARSAPWSKPPSSVSQILEDLNGCLCFLVFSLAVCSLPSIHRDPKRNSPYGGLETPSLTHYIFDSFGFLISGRFSPQGLVVAVLSGWNSLPPKSRGALHFICSLLDFSQSI